MDTSIKLLLLEDDPLDAELNIITLETEGYRCEWERVQTKDEYIAALEKADYDLILIDYNLPAFDGMSALHILRDSGLDIPALLVSGNLGEELAIDSIKAGAVDYVHKDRLNRLGPSVKRALKENELHRIERAQASNLALFNKLNQSANSGASISELIEILSIETSNYADYFGITTFLLSEDE
ncbi:MAG TPA: response regulator, partial [Anaerolineales bacterium]|nr:response regulator [Anaerolineales bacterium]